MSHSAEAGDDCERREKEIAGKEGEGTCHSGSPACLPNNPTPPSKNGEDKNKNKNSNRMAWPTFLVMGKSLDKAPSLSFIILTHAPSAVWYVSVSLLLHHPEPMIHPAHGHWHPHILNQGPSNQPQSSRWLSGPFGALPRRMLTRTQIAEPNWELG